MKVLLAALLALIFACGGYQTEESGFSFEVYYSSGKLTFVSSEYVDLYYVSSTGERIYITSFRGTLVCYPYRDIFTFKLVLKCDIGGTYAEYYLPLFEEEYYTFVAASFTDEIIRRILFQ